MELAKLNVNNYFGEMALLKKDVVASGKVECMVLAREGFQKLLGTALEVCSDLVYGTHQNSNSAPPPTINCIFNEIL